MPGLHRKADYCWITSDGIEHKQRQDAVTHERRLVLRKALAPFVQSDGTLLASAAETAILGCPHVSILYPIGVPQ